MSDSEHTIRKVDWKSVFPFTHLFRGFRLAIDPSKLALALAAILLLYIGGRLMDSIWPTHSRAMPNEIQQYANYTGSDFHAIRKQAAETRYQNIRRALSETPQAQSLADVEDDLESKRGEWIKSVREEYDHLSPEDRTPQARRERDEAIAQIHQQYASEVRQLCSLSGEGLFIHFITFQIEQIDAVASRALALDAAGTLAALRNFFFVAPKWAITQHYVYFTIFFVFYILVTAILGGAISRICAVQVARDEKISIRQALRFSTGKVLSFIFAPLIPVIIIVVIALVLGVVSMLMSVAWIGGLWSIVVGALFILALLAGLVMTLTALGLIGGGHLMYPTIAVEGSDSFDAVSRSFSYLYARPWQLIFYSVVALIYGAITYLFLRYFLYLLLSLTHAGVGLFMWGKAKDGTPLLSAMWPAPPDAMNLSYSIDFASLGALHAIGAFLMAVWVYLIIAVLGAYVISLYFSSGTIIYYLMRREVDATPIDEVYLEPMEEDFTPAVSETSSEPTPDTPSSSSEPPSETDRSSPTNT